MATTEQVVRNILKKFPAKATPEDGQYELYVQQKVDEGLQAIKHGNVLRHEQVVKRMSKWLR